MRILSEKAFELKLNKRARLLGYWPIKLNPTWNKGLPDRLFVGPSGTTVFMELKKKGTGRASKLQDYYIRLLVMLGHNAYIVDDYDDAIKKLEAALLSSQSNQNDAGSGSGGAIP